MKNIKFYLTSLISAIVLLSGVSVYAYGSQVDTDNAITMPTALSSGSGAITTSLAGEVNYQFMEITSAKYAAIKKYESIYNLINAYIKGDASYDSLATKYETTYNQTANGIKTEYGIEFDEEGLNAIRGLWITELPTFDASVWEKADSKTISKDLTSFEGTKYYIAWVKIGDVYDADVYMLTGTKKEEVKQEEVKQEEVKQEEKKDDTVVKKTALPKTGIDSSLVGLIAITLAAAGVSYFKFSKIK